MKTVEVSSSIKGYHIFKRAPPHPSVNMKVTLEEGDPYDPNALTVVMPNLKEILSRLHLRITKEAIQSRSKNVPTRGIKTLAATKRVEQGTSVYMALQLLPTKYC